MQGAVDVELQLIAEHFEAQVARAGEDAGQVLGGAELLIGLAVEFDEQVGFVLAADGVVVDHADVEVAGELAGAGVACDEADVAAGRRGDDVGRFDGVGDGGGVERGEAEIRAGRGRDGGVPLNGERAGLLGPGAFEIRAVDRVGERIRGGQHRDLQGDGGGVEVIDARFRGADADRAGGGEGGVVGDDLELIVDEQFQLVADDFEAQVAGAGEDAGEILGEAELLIGLAVLFQEDGGFELAAARVVVDQADIEVAGELASAGVAGDHAGVRRRW